MSAPEKDMAELGAKLVTDYPDIAPPKNGPHLIVTGDVHANLLNAVNPLIAAGVLKLSPQVHKEMGEIYYRLYDDAEVAKLAYPAIRPIIDKPVKPNADQLRLLAKAETNKIHRALTAEEVQLLQKGEQVPKVTPKQIMGQAPLTHYQTLRLAAKQVNFISHETMTRGGGISPDQESVRALNLEPPRELTKKEQELLDRVAPLSLPDSWLTVKVPDQAQLERINLAKQQIEYIVQKRLDKLRPLTNEEKKLLDIYAPLPEGVSWSKVSLPDEGQQKLIIKALSEMDLVVKITSLDAFEGVEALALKDYLDYRKDDGGHTTDHRRLCEIIDGMQAGVPERRKDIMVRFIGDLLCDRGASDYYILKVLKKLKDSGVKFDVLLSNHDSFFIKLILNSQNSLNVEALKVVRQQIRVFSEKDNQGMSTTTMLRDIEEGLINEAEVRSLAREVYQPSLKGIAYSLTEDGGIDLDDHAGIDLEVVEAMARRVGVVYQDYDAKHLAQTINLINEKVQEHLQNNTLDLLYDDLVDPGGSATDIKDMPRERQEQQKRDNPFAWAMWARVSAEWKNLGIIVRPNAHPKFGYRLGWRQGHDSGTKPEGEHVKNFDTSQGKGRQLVAEPGTVASAVIPGEGQKNSVELTHEMLSDQIQTHRDTLFPGQEINKDVLFILKLLEETPPKIKDAQKYIVRHLLNPMLASREKQFFRDVAHYLVRQSAASQIAIETEAALRLPQVESLIIRQAQLLGLPPYDEHDIRKKPLVDKYNQAISASNAEDTKPMTSKEKKEAISAYNALEKFETAFKAMKSDYDRALALVRKDRESPFGPPLTRSERQFVRRAFKAVEDFNQKWVSVYIEKMAGKPWGNDPKDLARRQVMLDLLRPVGPEGPVEAFKRARVKAVEHLAELKKAQPKDDGAIKQWDSFQTYINTRLVDFAVPIKSEGFSDTNRAVAEFREHVELAFAYNLRGSLGKAVSTGVDSWANAQYEPNALDVIQFEAKITLLGKYLNIEDYLSGVKYSFLNPLLDLVWNELTKPCFEPVPKQGDTVALAATYLERQRRKGDIDVGVLKKAEAHIVEQLAGKLEPKAEEVFRHLLADVRTALQNAEQVQAAALQRAQPVPPPVSPNAAAATAAALPAEAPQPAQAPPAAGSALNMEPVVQSPQVVAIGDDHADIPKPVAPPVSPNAAAAAPAEAAAQPAQASNIVLSIDFDATLSNVEVNTGGGKGEEYKVDPWLKQMVEFAAQNQIPAYITTHRHHERVWNNINDKCGFSATNNDPDAIVDSCVFAFQQRFPHLKVHTPGLIAFSDHRDAYTQQLASFEAKILNLVRGDPGKGQVLMRAAMKIYNKNSSIQADQALPDKKEAPDEIHQRVQDKLKSSELVKWIEAAHPEFSATEKTSLKELVKLYAEAMEFQRYNLRGEVEDRNTNKMVQLEDIHQLHAQATLHHIDDSNAVVGGVMDRQDSNYHAYYFNPKHPSEDHTWVVQLRENLPEEQRERFDATLAPGQHQEISQAIEDREFFAGMAKAIEAVGGEGGEKIREYHTLTHYLYKLPEQARTTVLNQMPAARREASEQINLSDTKKQLSEMISSDRANLENPVAIAALSEVIAAIDKTTFLEGAHDLLKQKMIERMTLLTDPDSDTLYVTYKKAVNVFYGDKTEFKTFMEACKEEVKGIKAVKALLQHELKSALPVIGSSKQKAIQALSDTCSQHLDEYLKTGNASQLLQLKSTLESQEAGPGPVRLREALATQVSHVLRAEGFQDVKSKSEMQLEGLQVKARAIRTKLDARIEKLSSSTGDIQSIQRSKEVIKLRTALETGDTNLRDHMKNPQAHSGTVEQAKSDLISPLEAAAKSAYTKMVVNNVKKVLYGAGYVFSLKEDRSQYFVDKIAEIKKKNDSLKAHRQDVKDTIEDIRPKSR